MAESYPEHKATLDTIRKAIIGQIYCFEEVDYKPHIRGAYSFDKGDIFKRLCTAAQMLVEIEEIFETCLVEEGERKI